MSCEFESKIIAAEHESSSPQVRQILADHVANCPECAAHLADLQKISAMLKSAPRARMSDDALRRLEQSWWRQRDRGVLRLAEWLTAAAAAVILLNLVHLPRSTVSVNPENATAWQAAALIPPPQTRDDASGDVVAVAEWMANDLSDASR
jgi:anti-sigma factor RsiW